MKPDILKLLASGAKSETELAEFFGVELMPLVLKSIEEMIDQGLLTAQGRQIHEGNNVFHWIREYRLSLYTAA